MGTQSIFPIFREKAGVTISAAGVILTAREDASGFRWFLDKNQNGGRFWT